MARWNTHIAIKILFYMSKFINFLYLNLKDFLSIICATGVT